MTDHAAWLRRYGLATLLAAHALCQAADTTPLDRFARQRGWEDHAVARTAGPGVPDVTPVTYSEKGSFAPSCGLLVTAPGAKAPALLELSGPEQGQGWPQCERIESLAAFRLANRQYMAVGFIQRDTREDRYRYYDYFYRDAAGGYVPDPALSNVAATAMRRPGRRTA